MNNLTDKPWYDRDVMNLLMSLSNINSDGDIATYFQAQGHIVSRRAVTDARNSLGIPAKSKSEPVYEIDFEPPRMLFIDIETRPNLGYFWRLYDENIGISQLVDEHEVLCFAAMWKGANDVEFYSTYAHGKDEMILQAHRLLDEADVVLHWNGKKFDIPHLNREFILAGLQPPSTFKQIDLMMVARQRFKFASNKLQHISTALGLEGKFVHEGFELWVKCMAGEPEAWETMETYNRRDVTLLDEIYEIMLPWINSHPNVPLYRGAGQCPNCGSKDLVSNGKTYTNQRSYERFRCTGCGAQMRGNKYIDSTGFIPVSY